jgi:hypothetical protein
MRAGDRLSEDPINPYDVLAIKGPRAVQEYPLNEIQEVYRPKGVKINVSVRPSQVRGAEEAVASDLAAARRSGRPANRRRAW